MKSELFDELIEGVRQGGKIIRGEIQPARVWPVDKIRKDVAENDNRTKYLYTPNERITH